MNRYLIVNADDFGLSTGVNCGIIECIERGVVTSASLMVRQPEAAEAAAYGKHNSTISIGLHLDLGEWIFKNGDWIQLYEVVPTDDADGVKREVGRQLAEFCDLMGRQPTHLDSHQHAHRNDPVHAVLFEAARTLSIPLRQYDSRIRYCGDFYGQTGEGKSLPGAISVAGLKRILKVLPEGVTELGCHPGRAKDLNSAYLIEREQEIRTLCSPVIQTSLRKWNIELRSFGNLAGCR